MPLISIIIPVYNAAETLPATIASLQSQALTGWEAILVDDGSTDASREIASKLASEDARIRLVRNPGKGPSAARNYGALKEARAPIVAFCDADDLWEARKLREVADNLLNLEADAVYGRIGFFNDDPSVVRTRSTVPAGAVTVPQLMGENPVCTMSNLSIWRETFRDVGGFREDMVHNEDLEFLIRLVGRGNSLKGINSDHVLYRLSQGGLSADLDAMRAGRVEALVTAQQHGFAPNPRGEAVYMRYLARRALRLGAPAQTVRELVAEGCRNSATAFLLPLRRGGMIAMAALCLPVLPQSARQFLFSN